jgi:hypothetical protein
MRDPIPSNGQTIAQIRAKPTVMDDAGKIHESVFRSFHIVSKIKNFLQRGVPTDVILELIDEMEGLDV